MENLVFTQLSIPELRAIFRQEIESVLSQHKSNSPQPESDEIGGIALAQEITGLARPTIYGLVSQSKIPCMKKGKKLYFSRTELNDWIRQGRRKTADDIEAEANSYLSNKGNYKSSERRAAR
jgi:excisionase family DNA binding protein